MAGRPGVAALRPLAADDVEPVAAWLTGVAETIGCPAWAGEAALHAPPAGARLLTDDTRELLLGYRPATPRRDAAQVTLLAVAPGRRRLGAGACAVLAFEALLPRSTRRVYVAVPARLGLALYFWLRLGYRPLTRGAWPAEPEDAPSVWMVRAR